jgi:hypothetical protein
MWSRYSRVFSLCATKRALLGDFNAAAFKAARWGGRVDFSGVGSLVVDDSAAAATVFFFRASARLKKLICDGVPRSFFFALSTISSHSGSVADIFLAASFEPFGHFAVFAAVAGTGTVLIARYDDHGGKNGVRGMSEMGPSTVEEEAETTMGADDVEEEAGVDGVAGVEAGAAAAAEGGARLDWVAARGTDGVRAADRGA